MTTAESSDALDLGDQDWKALLAELPEGWGDLAVEHGAVERLRGFRSIEALLRTLLLHLCNGLSLRECSATARAAGWVAQISDVALLKRLRKSEEWLRHLCLQALEDAGARAPLVPGGLRMKIIDASVIKESGKTGSSWLLHYCMDLPGMRCSHFELTPLRGEGNGEKLTRFPARAGECILAEAAYCNAEAFARAQAGGAHLITRYCSGTLSLCDGSGEPWPLLERMDLPGAVAEVAEAGAFIKDPSGALRPCRICVLKRSKFATQRALKRLERRAQKDGARLRATTLQLASYSIIVTDAPRRILETRGVLDCYRYRWQIEVLFKRFKSIARLGCLPKRDPASSRAWLYGKLLTCLLVEKLIGQAERFSPWGYTLEQNPQPMA